MLSNTGKVFVGIVVSLSLSTLLTIAGQASDERTGRQADSDNIGLAEIGNRRAAVQQSGRLESLLNANGTVNFSTGFRGSVDFKGYEMAVGRNGQPHFVRTAEQSSIETTAVPDDVYWDNRFLKPGFGTVWAVAVTGGGLYVGGSFSVPDGVAINNIARWDGTSWSNLGGGVDDTVRGIAVSGNDVYVCGDFLHAGGLEANGVAKWNGTSWSALGTGIPRVCPGCVGTTRSIAVSGNDLYVGGLFTSAGEVPANGIARWNGTSWSALGPGIAGVRSIVVSGNDVYVAGEFRSAAGVGANGIARWNGGNWFALGSGVAGPAYVVATSGSDVYVGGFFDMAGGVPAKNVAKWNGATWSALGSGTEGLVSALAISGNDVYAGLDLSVPFGQRPDRIVKWNGTSWSGLGKGVAYDLDDRKVYVFALAAHGTDVFVGGDFILAGDLFARGLAKWDGTAWSTMGKGLNGTAAALLVGENELFVGGAFQDVAGIRASGVARWDGTNWSAVGSGVRFFEIRAMALSGSNLYVGGQIREPGGVVLPSGRDTSNVAVWDGTRWSVLGSGFSDCNGLTCVPNINAIAVSGGNVYVAGSFTTANGVNASNIARWNGVSWSPVGNGLDGEVRALVTSGADLYAGGFFGVAGQAAARSIAKWNGSEWSPLGKGVNGVVSALAIGGNSLYAGGNFSKAGTIKASNIARWDGSEWTALAEGTDGGVFALLVNGTNLFVAGQFAQAGSVAAKDIARWNGREWFALGSGVSHGNYPGFGLALAVFQGDVYLGGGFDNAGGKPSYGFARWTGPADQAPSPQINSVSVNRKKLFVIGQDFDDGAVVLINGVEQKTTNDTASPTTRLIAKKAGKKVKAGDKLRIRNSDGTISPEFSFPG